jgi:hypothetical protein
MLRITVTLISRKPRTGLILTQLKSAFNVNLYYFSINK